MMSSSKEVLKINNLRMSYPKSNGWVLDGLNLQVNKGERIALIGSSGCGKSSVARAIMQLLPPGTICEGSLTLVGENILDLDQFGLQRIRGVEVGLVFQDPMTRLNPLMTTSLRISSYFSSS